MKNINLSFILLIAFGLTSCSSIKTYTDYDKSINFKQYSSYSFFEDMETGLNELNERRFSKAVNAVLQEKGFAQNDHPDFTINYYSEIYRKTNRNNLSIGIGTVGSHVGGNVSSGIPIETNNRMLSLTLEIVDSKKNILVWQGEADAKIKSNLNPKEQETFFKKIAEKILKEFPPKN